MQHVPENTDNAVLLGADAQGKQQGAMLALVTIVGIVVYVIIDVIAQLLPPHYNAIIQAESDLAVGPYGFLMTINFVISWAAFAGTVDRIDTGVIKGRPISIGTGVAGHMGRWSIPARTLPNGSRGTQTNIARADLPASGLHRVYLCGAGRTVALTTFRGR